MADQKTMRRMVVLVDGSEQHEDKKHVNQSSIRRLRQIVRDGVCPSGGFFVQIPRYYVATAAGASSQKLSDMFKSNKTVDDTPGLIKSIVKDICTTLTSPEDELWLYGSGHGAYVARVVAGIVHRLGLPRQEFDESYDNACALIKAQLEDDYKNGPRLVQAIKNRCLDPPRIPFVGLFDTVKLASPKTATYDISFHPGIQSVRHALAINETRVSKNPELIEVPANAEMAGRSLIQAWFLGTHEDLCGGTANDGLSLYPLQWMLLESIKAGLSVGLEKSTAADNPLSLVFPQFAGGIPNLDGSEDIEWRIPYANDVQVSMFDLQSSHAIKSTDGVEIHSLKFPPERYKRNAVRKVFGIKDLNGWTATSPHGTIIHPSLFCVLDRYPRYLELNNFKLMKPRLADFQDNCMVDDKNAIAPWLRDMQLQASGVKAFRILVCGKTGVGKSTLINKVFGVEMTSESQTYEQGAHDINVAFESPRHPGLLIHDSRGWQAGSDTELDLIAKFLRHRAFLQDPVEALHVIWFCVDADVSRIEEADKRTFETIAQYSNQVPVFVVGTKKDKMTGYRKMQLLEELMEKMDDYKEAKRLAEVKANEMADAQFAELRNQLSQIEHYKADGFCCLSKNDDAGVRDLLSQTLGLIADERVRLFCVAAQVVDVEQKINSAITECMRLGTHAIRTAAVPLPFTGLIGTPTVSRLICEHVLQCFGFPKATPIEVEEIMSSIVMGNLKTFMKVSLTQFAASSAIAIGTAVPTAGIGVIVGAAGCLWSMPPTARMLLKCSLDMILILERSFRYEGKYVSLKQIEDAAKYYTKTTITTFSGKEKLLQLQVHDEIDQLIPLKKVSVCFKFNKLRSDVERIVYNNRFGRPPEYDSLKSTSSLVVGGSSRPAELPGGLVISELPGDMSHPVAELDAGPQPQASSTPAIEVEQAQVPHSPTTATSVSRSEFGSPVATTSTLATTLTDLSQTSSVATSTQPAELDSNPGVGTAASSVTSDAPSGSKWGKRLSVFKIGHKKSKSKLK